MFIRFGEVPTVSLVVYWPVISLDASLVLVVGLTSIAFASSRFRHSSQNQNAKKLSRSP